MYDPRVGRFFEEDADGLDAGPDLYEYVDNQATTAKDPSGQKLYVPYPTFVEWERKLELGGDMLSGDGYYGSFLGLKVSAEGRTSHAILHDKVAALFPENLKAEAMTALFNGDVAAAHPNYSPASDRVYVPNLRMLRENQRSREVLRKRGEPGWDYEIPRTNLDSPHLLPAIAAAMYDIVPGWASKEDVDAAIPEKQAKNVYNGYFFSGAGEGPPSQSYGLSNPLISRLFESSPLDNEHKHYYATQVAYAFDILFPSFFPILSGIANKGNPIAHNVQDDDSVRQAVKSATDAAARGEKVFVIGFSRGAVLAVEFARQLSERKIKVEYLGLIDPVSTGLANVPSAIPTNVKRVFYVHKKNKQEGYFFDIDHMLDTCEFYTPSTVSTGTADLKNKHRIKNDWSGRTTAVEVDMPHKAMGGDDKESYELLVNDAKSHGIPLALPPGVK